MNNGHKYCVLLIHPDILRKNIESSDLFPSLGVNLLATVLNKSGFNTLVIDPFFLSLRNNSPNLKHYIREILKENGNIKIVGISTNIQTIKICIEIAKFVKSLNPNTTTILGGPGVNNLEIELLTHYPQNIDYIALGEGEETILEFVNAIINKGEIEKVPGLVFNNYKSTGTVEYTQKRNELKNLDSIPFPDYSQYINCFSNSSLSSVCLMMNRGCPFNCNYCSIQGIWEKVRYRSAKNIVDEIEYLVESFGVKKIHIHDDTFGSNHKQTIDMLNGIVERKIKIEMYAHTRFEVMNDSILSLYKKAGGKSIFYGLETGSERLRNEMGRKMSNKMIIDVVDMTKKNGLEFGTFILFGYPKESKNDIIDTYNFLNLIQPDDIYCSTVKIQPGSELYHQAIREKKITNDKWIFGEQEFYTFYEDKVKLYQGVQLLFYKKFKKQFLRNTYETNNDLMGVEQDEINNLVTLAKNYLKM